MGTVIGLQPAVPLCTEDFWYLQQRPLGVSEPELSEPHFTHRVGSCWESVATFLPPL